MLKGIDPLLNAELLMVLRMMGHGDRLVIADSNFPAETVAAATTYGKCLRMDVNAPSAMRAILTVLPLDTFVDDAVARMEVVDQPEEVPHVQAEVLREVRLAEGSERTFTNVERFRFYEESKDAFAVLQTSERRFYGCFMLRKGVIPPT